MLTCPTDTGFGSFTHKFFRVAHSREDLIGQRDAIAHWARLSYGWMGRSPDYKASLMNALGANAAFYEKFAATPRTGTAASLNDTDLAVMFITPLNAPGVKMICRTSYAMTAQAMGTPYDCPLWHL